MQVQLELWPALDESTDQTALWETIDAQCRERLVAALARLIRQSVSVPANNATEEGEHE